MVELKGDKIVITLPLGEPELSTSGKNFILASTGGNRDSGLKTKDGKAIIIGVNVYVKNPDFKKEGA